MASLAYLTFGDGGGPTKVLCLGAHCDDIEMGCGATLVDLAARSRRLEIHAVIFCSDAKREKETREGLSALLGKNADLTLHFGRLRDGYLPYDAARAKDFLVDVLGKLAPDLVITHSRGDLHQDHRFVAEVTYQAVRNGLILEMEIPKYDGDLGRPNVYVPVSEDAANRKISTIMACYSSQSGKHWFTEDTFAAIMRLRGVECKSESGMAEAFHSSKIVIR